MCADKGRLSFPRDIGTLNLEFWFVSVQVVSGAVAQAPARTARRPLSSRGATGPPCPPRPAPAGPRTLWPALARPGTLQTSWPAQAHPSYLGLFSGSFGASVVAAPSGEYFVPGRFGALPSVILVSFWLSQGLGRFGALCAVILASFWLSPGFGRFPALPVGISASFSLSAGLGRFGLFWWVFWSLPGNTSVLVARNTRVEKNRNDMCTKGQIDVITNVYKCKTNANINVKAQMISDNDSVSYLNVSSHPHGNHLQCKRDQHEVEKT